MIGFTFRGIHSSNFNIGFRSVDRSFLPAKRKKEYVIPGRSGTLEFETFEYDNRKITGEIGILKTEAFEELRGKARGLAQWLSGKGLLIFDDEPDKAYQATVYNAIGLGQLKLLPKAIIKIEFNCQPFAESVELHRISKSGQNNIELNAVNSGTTKTQAKIIIENTGSTNITEINISRKVVI